MPKYRIPISGALLVEAKTAHEARIKAGMWTVSVRQMTQGVPVQDSTGVLASQVSADKEAILDVTADYSAKKADLEKKYRGFPQELAEAYTDYYVGEQMWFELFEGIS